MKGTARKKILAAVLCAALSWQGCVWAADQTIISNPAAGTNDNGHTHTITLSGAIVADALSGTAGTAGAFTIKNSVISGITFDSSGQITNIQFAKNTDGYEAISIGSGATANALQGDTIAIGRNAEAKGNYATALGKEAKALASDTIAIGRSATASAHDDIAIGHSATASSYCSIALGNGAEAKAQYATAIGYGANSSKDSAIALGRSATASGNYATALGYKAEASAYSATAIGYNAKASADSAIALGRSATASGNYATALGYKAEADKENSVAIGAGSYVTAKDTVSFGNLSSSGTAPKYRNLEGIKDVYVSGGINFTEAGVGTSDALDRGELQGVTKINGITLTQNTNNKTSSYGQIVFDSTNGAVTSINDGKILFGTDGAVTKINSIGYSGNAIGTEGTLVSNINGDSSIKFAADGTVATINGTEFSSLLTGADLGKIEFYTNESGNNTFVKSINESVKFDKDSGAVTKINSVGYSGSAIGTADALVSNINGEGSINFADDGTVDTINGTAFSKVQGVVNKITVATDEKAYITAINGEDSIAFNNADGTVASINGIALTKAADSSSFGEIDFDASGNVTSINDISLTKNADGSKTFGSIVFDTNGAVTKINDVGYSGRAIGTKDGGYVTKINESVVFDNTGKVTSINSDSIVFDETTGAVSTINGTEFSQLVTKDDLGSIEFDTTNENGYVTSINESVNFDSTSGKVTDINDSVKFDKDSGAVSEINGIAYSQDTTNKTSSIGGVTFDASENGEGYVKNINGEKSILFAADGTVSTINGTAFSHVQGVVEQITVDTTVGGSGYITGINGSSLSFSSADGSVSQINGVALTQGTGTSSYGSIVFDDKGNVTSINGTDFSALQNANVDFSGITSDITSLQTSVSGIESDITTIEGSVTTINGNISTIQGNITSIQTDLTNLQNTVKDLNLTVDGTDIKPASVTTDKVTVGTTENGGTQTVIDNTGATFTSAAGTTTINGGGVTTTTVNAADVKATTVTTGQTTVNDDGVSIADKTVITDSDVVINKGTEQEVSLSGVGGRMGAAENRIGHLENRVERLGDEIDEVGALGAALAGLHPMDTNSRTDIAVALGSYDGNQAVALGAFYRPDKRTMLSVGASATDSRQMFNMGVSFALDRLPEKPAADSEVLAAVMARLEKLEAENAQLRAQYEELKTQQQQQQTTE